MRLFFTFAMHRFFLRSIYICMFGITNENCRKYLRPNKRESNKHRLTDTEDATRVESETSKKNFCTISANVFFFAFFRNHCRFSEICSAEFNIDTIHCCTDNGFGFFFSFLGNKNMTKTRTNELIYHRHHTNTNMRARLHPQ